VAQQWLVFPLSKMNILRDEGGHFMFFRKSLRVLAGTLAHLLGPTSAPADGMHTSKGGVSPSILYSVCVVKAQQPKLSALGLSSAPPASLNHALSPPPLVSLDVCVGSFPRKLVHVVCKWPMQRAVTYNWHNDVRPSNN
jgi:hypothetical protein